jgi:hypothetical protein
VVVQLPFQKGAVLRKEGFANLATDSDYSYLADHVNANPLAPVALTCCSETVFSTAPEFIIQTLNLSPKNLSRQHTLKMPHFRKGGKYDAFPLFLAPPDP